MKPWFCGMNTVQQFLLPCDIKISVVQPFIAVALLPDDAEII
jgi:hypothetical protein